MLQSTYHLATCAHFSKFASNDDILIEFDIINREFEHVYFMQVESIVQTYHAYPLQQAGSEIPGLPTH